MEQIFGQEQFLTFLLAFDLFFDLLPQLWIGRFTLRGRHLWLLHLTFTVLARKSNWARKEASLLCQIMAGQIKDVIPGQNEVKARHDLMGSLYDTIGLYERRNQPKILPGKVYGNTEVVYLVVGV